MDDLARIWSDLGGRIGGPMSFRLVLQPAVATVLAIKAGLADARAGHPPYFWSIATDPAHRAMLLREGWKAVAKIFVLAIIIDVAYQVKVFGWVYPGELILIAFLLACAPYLLVRGFVTRIVAGPHRRHQP